jgi:hypothetical protein
MMWVTLFAFLMVGWGLRNRRQKAPAYSLRPNCLISRNPFLFIGNGKRSRNDLPQFLADHGYEVRTATLSTMQQYLSETSAKFHLVFDFTLKGDAKSFMTCSLPSIASVTVLSDPLSYEMTRNHLLDRAVLLAEQDYTTWEGNQHDKHPSGSR